MGRLTSFIETDTEIQIPLESWSGRSGHSLIGKLHAKINDWQKLFRWAGNQTKGPKLYDPWQIMLKQREKGWSSGTDTRTQGHTHMYPNWKKSFTEHFSPLQHMIPSDIFYFVLFYFIFLILVVLKCLRSTMMVDFPTGSVDKESIWSDMTFIWS